MTAIDKQSKEYLDFCDKEYSRVAGIKESQIKSSSDDFKMFGPIGSMLAWKPIEASFVEASSPK